MSTETRWRQRYENFQKALLELDDAVQQGEYSKLERQGLIQCFEYTIELAWKTLQDILNAKGFDISGPKPVIRQAFSEGYIDNDEEWLLMWDARLRTAHTYDETTAIEIADKIRNTYYHLFNDLDKRLAQEPDTF